MPKIKEYDVLRVIATLLVVVGHCAYISISTEYGWCDYISLLEQGCFGFPFMFKLLSGGVALIYAFHMPLYMALSGALFCVQLKKDKYGNKTRLLIADKGKRLLLPFVLVTFFYNIPIKLASGYFPYKDSRMKDIFVGQFLLQGNSHLWYLPALFLLSFIVWQLFRMGLFNSRRKKVTIVFVAIAIYYLRCFGKITIVSNLMEYFLWFLVGFYFEDIRSTLLKKTFSQTYIIGGCAICGFIILFAVGWLSNDETINYIVKPITAMCGCLSIYCVAGLLAKTEVCNKTSFKLILKESYGIYLYSDAWNYFILYVVTTICGIEVFATNLGFTAVFIARCVLTLGISILVSKTLGRIKAIVR